MPKDSGKSRLRAARQRSLNVLASGSTGAGALRTAVSRGDAAAVAMHLQAGADATESDESGTTPLHLVRPGDVGSLQALLVAGADVDAADSKGRTMLHLASARGDAEVVAVLLDRGADPNLRDMNGNLPLHLAACTSNVRLLTLLLRAGCDPHAKDGLGRSPLNYAASHLKLVQRYNAKYSADEHRSKIADVVELLRTFMERIGDKDGSAGLDKLGSQLDQLTTKEEADELHGLLDNFLALSIDRLGSQEQKDQAAASAAS